MRITDHIPQERMSGLQRRAVAIAITLVVLDGYDVSLTSFAAPYIERGFGVSKAELGLVMSGALIGMLVGSIIVAPLADRIGRRKMGVVATSTIAAGMFIGPFATPETGTWPLVLSRIVTGVGVGCLVAVVGVVLAEYTGKRVYALVMALYAAAINIGGLLGSMIVGPMLDARGWQLGWWIGFALSAVAAIATYALLPESLAWLAEGRRPDALERLNALLTKMRRPVLAALPEPENTGGRREGLAAHRLHRPYRRLHPADDRRLRRLHAQLLLHDQLGAQQRGLGQRQPRAGPAARDRLQHRRHPRQRPLRLPRRQDRRPRPHPRLPAPGHRHPVVVRHRRLPDAHRLVDPVHRVLLRLLGHRAFYAIVPTLYPPLARSTGFGVVIGIGRFGGIAAPVVGGAAFDAGWGMGAAFTVFSLPMLIAGVSVIALHVARRRPDAGAAQHPEAVLSGTSA
ncbi:hypothetical protein GCM10020256_69990 [Streptomyces thermocoprophilus]